MTRFAYRPILSPFPDGYIPSVDELERLREAQAASDRRWAGYEWEIVEAVLPMGCGKGFRSQWFKDGEPIKDPTI